MVVTVMPFFSRFKTVWSSAFRTGDKGSMFSSFHSTPMTGFSFFVCIPVDGAGWPSSFVFHHRPGRTLASSCHIFAPSTDSIKRSMSAKFLAIGPTLASKPTLPVAGNCPVSCPPLGILPRLGLKPTTPLHIAGILMLPPRSVPTPITHPLMATRTPSPPELPPAVQSDRFHGLSTRPKTLFILSKAWSV